MSHILDKIETVYPFPPKPIPLSQEEEADYIERIKKLLKDGFLSDNVFCPLPKWEQIESEFFINTLITTDKTPNRAGALALKI